MATAPAARPSPSLVMWSSTSLLCGSFNSPEPLMELNFSDTNKVHVEDDTVNFFTSFLCTLRRTDTVTLQAIDHLVELFKFCYIGGERREFSIFKCRHTLSSLGCRVGTDLPFVEGVVQLHQAIS